MKKYSLNLVFLFLFLSTLLMAQDQRPNVILILADDMALGDLSLLNEGRSRTPNLDKLIGESAWFEQAYSASAVCTPARAALLTGRYPHRTGAVTLNMQRYPELSSLNLKETTIADIFSENGYATGIVGKWHVGNRKAYHPMKRGFDEFAGFLGYYVPDDYFNYRLDIQGEIKEFKDRYLTDELTARAIDFVQKHREEPFFLHLAHYAPHRPLSAPQEKIDHYLKKGIDKNTAIVYAMIEVMDKGIGDLLTELDDLGVRENTIVVFASDNGPDPLVGERFNLDMRGTKYLIYEGGIRIPLLINWPGKMKPSKRREVIHLTDILPTVAELCSLEIPSDLKLDGGSMAGLLMGKKSQLPERRFWQWNRGVPMYSHNAAMREGDWKLVRPYVTRNVPNGPSIEKPVLYNLKEDPQETTDLSEEESTRYDVMRVKLEQWCREVERDRIRE